VVYSSSWETHRRATERHLPYGITQCYLQPDTGEPYVPHPYPSQAGRYSIYRSQMDERLSWPGYILRWFTCPQTVTHPSSYQDRGSKSRLLIVSPAS